METTQPLHFPGTSYFGPGTHVRENIEKHIAPSNEADLSALLHDVNYALANGDQQLLKLADDKALSRLSFTDPMYWVMRVGLKTRQSMHLYEGEKSHYSKTQLSNMKRQLLSDPFYQQFGIKDSDFVK